MDQVKRPMRERAGGWITGATAGARGGRLLAMCRAGGGEAARV